MKTCVTKTNIYKSYTQRNPNEVDCSKLYHVFPFVTRFESFIRNEVTEVLSIGGRKISNITFPLKDAETQIVEPMFLFPWAH